MKIVSENRFSGKTYFYTIAYRPEELSIKTDGDVLVVLAKHETKTESGGSFVSKQFEQRFTLPSGVREEEAIQCCCREIRVTQRCIH